MIIEEKMPADKNPLEKYKTPHHDLFYIFQILFWVTLIINCEIVKLMNEKKLDASKSLGTKIWMYIFLGFVSAFSIFFFVLAFLYVIV